MEAAESILQKFDKKWLNRNHYSIPLMCIPLTQSLAVTSAPSSTSNLTQSMYFFMQAIITGVW